MEEQKIDINGLKKWLSEASSFSLPTYRELPPVPLYMEQVITYINEVLAPFSEGNKKALTSFMVNNYVKAKMISEPVKKKYSADQIGYLIAISTLKEALSMPEIALLIDMDEGISTDSPILYRFYREMSQDIIRSESEQVSKKVKIYEESYEAQKEKGNQDAREMYLDGLGLTALRLAIRSAIDKLLAQALLDEIAKEKLSQSSYAITSTKSHKENKKIAKAEHKEAKRVRSAKKANRGAAKNNPKKEAGGKEGK